MKRLTTLLLGIALLSVISPDETVAQKSYSFEDSLGRYDVSFTPHEPTRTTRTESVKSQRTNLTGHHEVRLGIAYNPYTPHDYAPNFQWCNYPLDIPKNTIVGNTRWYTVNGDYGYWFRRWLYVGGVASWTGGFKRISSAIDHSRVDAYNYNTLTLMPIVRFAWLNRGIVQLYSGVGIGGSVAIYEPTLKGPLATSWKMNFDVTFIGITVGKRWFGYFDIGAGGRGTISAGAGYRFTTNTKR